MKKTYLLVGLFCISIITIGIALINIRLNHSIKSKAATPSLLYGGAVTTQLFAEKEEMLYTAHLEKGLAANEFIQKNIKGVEATDSPSSNKLSHYLASTYTTDTDLFYSQRGITLGTEHYRYQQTYTFKGKQIPIYGATAVVHMKNDNQIYGYQSNLLPTVLFSEAVRYTEQQARKIAIEEAAKDTTQKNVLVGQVEEFVYNPELIEYTEKGTSDLVYAVSVVSKNGMFGRKYFVSQTTGSILHTQELLRTALQRDITLGELSIVGSQIRVQNPKNQRTEGQSAIGIVSIDKTYDYMGGIYTKLKEAFQRDSYDNKGGLIQVGIISLNDAPSGYCPNAFWIGDNFQHIGVCENLITQDVLAHEFTHAITSSTSKLEYQYQSGSLDEGISDIFASYMDGNWTMGEGIKIFRDMSDPTKYNQPDKLFSSLYDCNDSQAGTDYGGVHKNSGIINKSFYLMANGGTFNGCAISGIGIERAIPIVYRVITTYLQKNSNFRDYYDYVLLACRELNPQNTTLCDEVDKSMKAVEIFQQEKQTLKSPLCFQKKAQTACTMASTTVPTVPQVPIPQQQATVVEKLGISKEYTPWAGWIVATNLNENLTVRLMYNNSVWVGKIPIILSKDKTWLSYYLPVGNRPLGCGTNIQCTVQVQIVDAADTVLSSTDLSIPL